MNLKRTVLQGAQDVAVLGIAALIVAACSSGTSTAGHPTLAAGAPGSGNAGSMSSTASGDARGAAGVSGVAVADAGSSRAGSGATAAVGTAGRTAAAGGSGPSAGSGGTGAAAAGASAGGAAGASSGAAGAQGPAVACNPADKKPDPKPVPFTQISGYQSMTKEPTTGPAKPVIESDPGFPDWTVYRPEHLDGETKHGILVWANGGCLKNGTLYGQWLLEVASYGFVVVADGQPQTASADPAAGGIRSGGADGKPQAMALDWIIAENERPCSQYFHKLDVTKVAAAGQSCGGLMSLQAAGDKRMTTAIIFNSGLFSADQAVYSALHTPIAYFIGGMSDVAYKNAEQDTSMINKVPLFYGNLDVGHGATWMETNAGEFGRVGLGWLKWQLNGDDTAKKLFVGADCELCKSPSKWTVKKKMID
jgi:hypothetical protein